MIDKDNCQHNWEFCRSAMGHLPEIQRCSKCGDKRTTADINLDEMRSEQKNSSFWLILIGIGTFIVAAINLILYLLKK